MKTTFQKIITITKNSFKDWFGKDPFRESAAIAYYAIFSLPGLLVVIIAVAGYFFGTEAVNNQLAVQLTSTMGADTAKQIQNMVAEASKFENSLLATIIGVVTILVGATGVFAQFQKSLNAIWEVKPDSGKSGIIELLKVRLFSFGLIVSIAFLLVISLVVSALLSAFGTWLAQMFSQAVVITVQSLNILFSFVILSTLFALMFKILPDAKIKWKHVWVGAVVTTLLFEIGKFALGLYFGKAEPGTGYGAAGSVILILLWVSYTSMIVLLGAEFTLNYAKMFSRNIAPSDFAKKNPHVRN
ncbi:MAG TPA: YihY/virulence factor BrkB family protein [Paludibacter sp.]|nr:YihY/virulence factor BrkB family protein [Paludibacter sp.]